MNKIIKYFILFIFSLNIYSSSDMNNFFSLQKEKDSLSKNIKLINSIYNLGYQEKAKQKLYILLDKYTKKEFNKNVNNILKLINKEKFDKSIINSLEFIIDKKPKKLLDKEIISIYNSKNEDNKNIKKEINKSTDLAKSKDKTVFYPTKNTNGEKNKKNKNNELNTVHKHNINSTPLNKNIETAIVLSELLDDLDIEMALKYSLVLPNDPYFSIISQYLNYLKNKNIKQVESINKKNPLYYHLLISIYKNNNQEKAKIYLDKIKKEYPKYLKYNRIDL